jgi:ATP-dependent Clp protease protease subunit
VHTPLFDYDGRVVSLLGRIDSHHLDVLTDQFLRLDTDSKKEITLYVSCAGGNLVDAFRMLDILNALRSPVTSIALGLVEGIGVLIFAAANKRYILPSALLSTAGLWALPERVIAPISGFGAARVYSHEDLIQVLKKQVDELGLTRSVHLCRVVHEAAQSPRLFSAEQAIAFDLADVIGPNRRILNRAKTPPHQHVR